MFDAFSTFQIPVWSEVPAPQRRPLPPLVTQTQVPQPSPQEKRLVILELRQLQINPALCTASCILYSQSKLG